MWWDYNKKIEKKLNSFNALIKMIVFKFVCSTEVSLRMSEMTKWPIYVSIIQKK